LERITAALLRLLERYGAAELASRHREATRTRCAASPIGAPERLRHRREQRQAPPPVVVKLPANIKARDAHVTPHNLESYDQSRSQPMNNLDTLQARAKALNLRSVGTLDARATESWVQTLIDWEEESAAPQPERRLREARIGRFKPICRLRLELAQALRPRRFRSLDVARLPQGRQQHCPGRSKRCRKVNAGPQSSPIRR